MRPHFLSDSGMPRKIKSPAGWLEVKEIISYRSRPSSSLFILIRNRLGLFSKCSTYMSLVFLKSSFTHFGPRLDFFWIFNSKYVHLHGNYSINISFSYHSAEAAWWLSLCWRSSSPKLGLKRQIQGGYISEDNLSGAAGGLQHSQKTAPQSSSCLP